MPEDEPSANNERQGEHEDNQDDNPGAESEEPRRSNGQSRNRQWHQSTLSVRHTQLLSRELLLDRPRTDPRRYLLKSRRVTCHNPAFPAVAWLRQPAPFSGRALDWSHPLQLNARLVLTRFVPLS